MDIVREFATDKKAEVEGKWVPLEEGRPGEILLARVQNPNWKRAFRSLPRSIRRQIQQGGVEAVGDEKFAQIMCELISKTILLNWRDLTLNEEPVQYSQQAAYDILMEYPDFRERVFELANDMETFRVEEAHDLGKDSELLSSGM